RHRRRDGRSSNRDGTAGEAPYTRRTDRQPERSEEVISQYLPLLLCAPLAIAQTFEVASVKPTSGDEIGGVYRYPGGRVSFRGCPLSYLIQLSFDAQPFQIVGAPTSSDR